MGLAWYKSKIKGALQRVLGPYALKELEIASVGARPNARYGIMMDRLTIEIVY
ncbi:MAG: hypothetical protein JRF31_07135 [Deltaproteobacteria bacterium]|nr:hypothetical protein [Deltaproteobacteria bacterium]MBW2013841.1 hypothetical protein [Deltaproteobacteria bacterium]MBW2087368.1 hypothetical protein [Deltaproteobacteria bacterium]MBW2320610.1 hypothetical protein [Deltaproteobacteria bacterium]